MSLPILMAEDYWANSHFSIARHYGQIRIGDQIYVIVNKFGATVFELSDPDSKYFVGFGADHAIAPGEPADLCLQEWIPIYKALGRDEFIKLLETKPSLKEAKAIAAQVRKRKRPKAKPKTEPDQPILPLADASSV